MEMNGDWSYGLCFSRTRKLTWLNFQQNCKSARHEGDLTCFQHRERKCCVWAGVETGGRHMVGFANAISGGEMAGWVTHHGETGCFGGAGVLC